MYRILVVDDEEEIVDLLELYIQKEGFEVVKAYDGIEAWENIKSQNIDLAVIDIMMPGINGFNLVKKIRREYNIPVIMLSAKREDHDKILGLGLGADDYITKPFNPMEVMARIHAQLRRFYNLNTAMSQEEGRDKIGIGELELDTAGCILRMGDKEVTLTSIEYKILKLLMENPNRVFTKKQIFETVWGEFFTGDDNTIMVHISNLRDKIEENARNPIYLKTIRGLGYKISDKLQ